MARANHPGRDPIPRPQGRNKKTPYGVLAMSLGAGARHVLYGCFILAFLLLLCLHGIGLGLVLALAAVLLPHKFCIPRFLTVLFAVSAVVHMAAVFVIQTPPASDFALLYNAAQQVAEGDFSFQNDVYFFRWAYQTGFVLWEAAILRVTGSMTCIKIVNALMLSGVNCLIYLFARRYTGERAAQAAALLYLATLFPTAMTCVLTNQHGSAFFFLLGLYVLTGDKGKSFPLRRSVLAGLCFALGNILRPEFILILAGLCGTAVFMMLAHRSVKKHLRFVLSIVLSAALCFGCVAAASAVISASGVNQYGLDNNWPEWKFILGFNHESQGGYSAADEALFGGAHFPDTPESAAAEAGDAERQVILERVFASPGQFIKLMLHKARMLWVEDGLYFPLGYWNADGVSVLGFSGPRLYEYAVYLDRTVLMGALLLALAGVAVLWRRKNEEQTVDAVLAPMTAMACFAAFLLIEVQPRYVFLPQIFLYITSAAGVDAFSKLLAPAQKEVDMPPPVRKPDTDM